jgi:hypothetical protein
MAFNEQMKGTWTYLKTFGKALLLVVTLLLHLGANAQLPDIPDIIRVTVDHADNGLLIQWIPSTDTGIVSYNVYTRNPDNSFQLLITLPASTLEYKDMINGPNNPAYSVTAINNAIPPSESLFEDNVHQAVGLSTEFDLCAQSNIVTWTPYAGWEGEISGYRIYGGMAGSPMQELDFVSASTNSYAHSGVQADTDYIYYVETIHSQTGNISLSAIDTIYTNYPEAPSYLTLDHVNVVDEATVEIQFSADIAGPVNSFRLLRRSDTAGPFLKLDTYWSIMESTQLVQDQLATGSFSYQYKIESLFQPAGCASSLVISESNHGNNILLTNSLDDPLITLSWTPYESYVHGLAGYIVQRLGDGGVFEDIETVGPLTTQWQESIQSLNNGFQAGEVQYRVIAISNAANGGAVEQSISNITTATVETHIQVPSAFTPGSNDINAEFKPLMDFAPEDYLMIVVDRGGRKMFETTDPGEGWDGRFQGGSYVDEAVYVYYIQFTDYTGLFRTFTGNVTALYP